MLVKFAGAHHTKEAHFDAAAADRHLVDFVPRDLDHLLLVVLLLWNCFDVVGDGVDVGRGS